MCWRKSVLTQGCYCYQCLNLASHKPQFCVSYCYLFMVQWEKLDNFRTSDQDGRGFLKSFGGVATPITPPESALAYLCDSMFLVDRVSVHAWALPQSVNQNWDLPCIWYVRFYAEVIGGGGSQVRTPLWAFFLHFFSFPFSLLSPIPFFLPCFFLSVLFSLQARSATSMLNHFSSLLHVYTL